MPTPAPRVRRSEHPGLTRASPASGSGDTGTIATGASQPRAVHTVQPPQAACRGQEGRLPVFKGGLLWLIGIPIPIIIVLLLLGVL